MKAMRLLERIRKADGTYRKTPVKGPEGLQDSILAHLSHLLNSRQGASIIDKSYGVPDLSQLTTQPNAENIARIEEILSDVVSRFEPRLANVRVQFVPNAIDEAKMSFTLVGETDDSEGYLSFTTVLTPNGRVSIKRSQS